MAIVMAGTSHAYSGTTTPTSVTKPAGTASGDFLLALASMGQDGAKGTTAISSSGWTQVGFWKGASGNYLPVTAVLWKPAGASEPASYSFTRTDPNNVNDELIVHVSRWTGVDTTSPFAVSPTNLDQTGNQRNPIAAPDITIPTGTGYAMVTAYSGAVWIGSAGTDNAGTPRFSTPTGMTSLSTYGATWAQLGSFYQFVNAGATGTRSSNMNPTSGQTSRGVSLALRPSSGGTPPPSGPEAGRFLLAV